MKENEMESVDTGYSLEFVDKWFWFEKYHITFLGQWEHRGETVADRVGVHQDLKFQPGNHKSFFLLLLSFML